MLQRNLDRAVLVRNVLKVAVGPSNPERSEDNDVPANETLSRRTQKQRKPQFWISPFHTHASRRETTFLSEAHLR